MMQQQDSASRAAYSITVQELARRIEENGAGGIPPELRTDAHLICNTPAAIDFNSPGAQGFGVKRAGLSVPSSIMLLVSPGCCGRNTAALSGSGHYGERFAYLALDEADIVTGSHLQRIPEAVRAFVASRRERPSVVMVCLTCADALLGTDMERVCRKAEAAAGVPVRPCYMYALTRESQRPPMQAVRETIYGLLQPRKKWARQANLLGFFTPVARDSELFSLLEKAGIRRAAELARCQTYEEFTSLAAANFNLVLSDEAMGAALALEKRLGIPAIRLRRLYETAKIAKQYQALAHILGSAPESFAAAEAREQAEKAADSFCQQYGCEAVLAIGSRLNANPFELALALVRRGLAVCEIFAVPSAANAFYLRELARCSPSTRIYSLLEPTMLCYREDRAVTLALGADACLCHPHAKHVTWNDEEQPFGYQAVRALFERMAAAMSSDEDNDINAADKEAAESSDELPVRESPHTVSSLPRLSLALPPFAPDTAGAAAVLYPLGGMTVIVDAGGCAGNICGFDEPRWQEDAEPSAVFSAGLRDMDAIMGRDANLVAKIREAAAELTVSFVGLVSTPVPAIIATDFRAVCRMVEKETGLPTIAVRTDGTRLYDRGASAACDALVQKFTAPIPHDAMRTGLGVLGLTPLDFSREERASLHALLGREDTPIRFFDRLDDFREAARLKELLVVSPAGLKAARRLQRQWGIPIRAELPPAFIHEAFSAVLSRLAALLQDGQQREILIVHQQILANGLRLAICQRFPALPAGAVTVGSFFLLDRELQWEGDLHFRGEQDFHAYLQAHPDAIVIGDALLARAVPEPFGGTLLDLPHFALSGRKAPMHPSRTLEYAKNSISN
ncbi:nitrogenase component 1 [Mitsuokella multacida]|uniref:nitrogenase component 1 n=1 Tax=Mitsuokella multacida TaxID=52226 RepID=UPI002673FCE6|nr:nitrogenase component 1 [Mitsuokella multacida]